jgi:hypothetical protein
MEFRKNRLLDACSLLLSKKDQTIGENCFLVSLNNQNKNEIDITEYNSCYVSTAKIILKRKRKLGVLQSSIVMLSFYNLSIQKLY